MNQFETKSVYWVLAILVIVIAPIFVLLTPAILSVVFFEDPNKIAFISFGKNLIVYTLAFFFASIALILLYFIKKLITKIVVIILTILGFCSIFLLGVNHYVYLDENYIEYNPLIGSKVVYDWSDLSRVGHVYPNDESGKEIYNFTFNDGYYFEFEATGAVDSSIKSKIDSKIRLHNVPLEQEFPSNENR
ncbi:hypothetical protein [Lysinibacillus sp. SGAir0095]|uniref:hypothetical protein n=1 Tax=Lysinibacillus sp. SGAir0095 TaxID=2070463 RepID=UPI0010CD0A8E|nr:hypothetical protein [Lysinibacillus sp. SGAir0095]QCR33321.1 hypothetical protein C1N55_14500 [Lysinibacillus sp. SGAir0095]